MFISTKQGTSTKKCSGSSRKKKMFLECWFSWKYWACTKCSGLSRKKTHAKFVSMPCNFKGERWSWNHFVDFGGSAPRKINKEEQVEGRAISGSQNFLHAKYTLKTKNFPPAAGRGIVRLANIPQKFSACGGPKDFLSKKFLALQYTPKIFRLRRAKRFS